MGIMMEVKKYPFTLLNGTAVLVKAYGPRDYEELNRWVRKKYMENVREACIGLDEQEKLELRLAALSKAARLTFQEGEGRDIVLSDIQGFARLGYQLIVDTGLTFDEYFKIIYPDGILTEDGLKSIIDMMNVAYPSEDGEENAVEASQTTQEEKNGEESGGGEARV